MNTANFTRTQQSVDAHQLKIVNEEWYNHGNNGLKSFKSELILDEKYENADIDSVIEGNCSHLPHDQ